MICRAVLLELTGSSTELELAALALRPGGPRGLALTWERVRLGGLRLEDDGWHLLGVQGTVGPNGYSTPETAIQIHLQGRAYELARRLAP